MMAVRITREQQEPDARHRQIPWQEAQRRAMLHLYGPEGPKRGTSKGTSKPLFEAADPDILQGQPQDL